MRDDEWGAGAPGQKEMEGHVLGKFAPDERPLLEDCLAKAEEATLLMMQEGFQAAANKFNVKKEKKPRYPFWKRLCIFLLGFPCNNAGDSP